MAIERRDRVKDSTTTTGTGTLTLSGTAPDGFRAFTDAHTTGATVRYAISLGAEWEVGEGVFTTSGNTLTRATVLASSNSGSLVDFSAGTKTVISTLTAAELDKLPYIGLPMDSIYGCILANNASDATNDIDIGVGARRDYADGGDIRITSALTKQLDADWAAGTNQGMRYSGAAIANTTYHLYAVAKADGTSDIYADPSEDHATVLGHLQAETGGSGYVYIRRIGSIVRASAAIRGFLHYGGARFRWKTLIRDLYAAPSTTAASKPLSLPTGINVFADIIFGHILSSVTTDTIYYSLVTSLDETNSTPTSSLYTLMAQESNANGFWYVESVNLLIKTDTSARVRTRCSGATGTHRIMTLGWTDYKQFEGL